MAFKPKNTPRLDPNEAPDPVMKKIKLHPGLLKFIIGATFGVYALLVFLGLMTWSTMLVPFFNLGGLLIVLPLIHFLVSWTVVKQDEWAALFFYQRALKSADAGPHFLPKGLIQVVRVPKGLKQFQAPGEPEEVFHGDEKEVLPPGKVWPIRVTTRGPREGETEHLDVQMTFEWPFYVQYQIKDLFMFISRVGSFEQAQRLIRDSGEAVQKQFASERTMRGVIEGTIEIDETLDNRIRELANEWGMEIYEARTLAPNLSHSVASELSKIPIARLQAEQVKTLAAGQRVRLEEEGAGVAKARSDLLTAEADGREAFLKAEAVGLAEKKKLLDISGETIVAAEVASDAFAQASGILMGGNSIAELSTVVEATREALKKGKEGKS